MGTLSSFLVPILNVKLLLLVLLGTFGGIWVGAIPGLSVTMAASLLISFTFSWDIYDAIALICGVYMGGVYGGGITSILLNIPGAPAAIATGFDGYPLTMKGEAPKALGLACTVSFFGGLLGIIVLLFAAPIISRIALQVAPRDYFLLAMMGILLLTSMGSGDTIKGIIAGAVGVLLSMVGMDPSTGEMRYTFGSVYLMQGISFVPAMIGLFGVTEGLSQARDVTVAAIKQNVDKIIPSLKLLLKYLPLSLRSALIGIWIGALPGTGGDIAALIAYDAAKRTVKKPSAPFGKGAYEGVIAPESANIAAVGGAFIPMLTLGIPGDAVTAIIIGAFIIHGLRPGPLFMVETPNMFGVIVSCLLIANIAKLIIAMCSIKFFTKVIDVPRAILIPVVIILSVIGTYAIQNSLVDVYWMLGFGVLGYFMRLYGFATAPMVLGLILGPILDSNYRRAMQSVNNDPMMFLHDLVTNPISLILVVFIVYMIISQTPQWKRFTSKARTKASASNR